MICYPIIIPTLNRYQHFRDCVESLAKNTYARDTELIIGVDYPPKVEYIEGNNKILEYVEHITGFKKVTIFKREKNYGGLNSKYLKDYALKHYDAVIYSEDDNIFSPHFLEYMNLALNHFKDDSRISTISGYNQQEFENITSSNFYLTYTSSAWGLGRWRDKEEYFENVFTRENVEHILFSYHNAFKIWKTIPSNLHELIVMYNRNAIYGDLIRSCLNIINNTYQLRPRKTLVVNRGQDGTGLHSFGDKVIQNQQIDISFNPYEEENQVYDIVKWHHALFYLHLSSNRAKAWLQIFKTMLIYLLFRIKKII